jgi:hypothetical protein
MQELVWKPANQVHTKTLAGLVVKLLVVTLLTVTLVPVVFTFVVLSSKRLSRRVKILIVGAELACLIAWLVIG